MSETHILQSIRLALGRVKGLVLWRNQTGALTDKNGRLVRFGLCVGGSDLVGFRSVVITEDMIGQKVAQLVCVECKTATGKVSPEQENFIRVVREAGGLAGVARSDDEARRLLRI